MKVWLWILIFIMAIIIVALLVKLYLMRKSAGEIEEALADRLKTDTNVLIDISGHDRYMRALADSINRELRILRSDRHRFRQGDSELKEAVTNISHDLRTPLTAICGYLELLETEEKTAEADRYLRIIRDRIEILKQLTEELFRYSIITSTLKDNSRETLVLNSLLEESISSYYAILKENKITPEIFMPDTKVVRKLDRSAVSRILGNIINNAVKYSDGDLRISLSEDGEIVFSNHAAELNEIQVGKLFNRFYTVETAERSTGLGLAIAKVLTEEMKGSITSDYCDGVVSIRVTFSKMPESVA